MWGVIKNFRDTVCALQSNCCIGLWQSSEVIPLVRQYTSPSGYPTFRNLSSAPPPFWSLLAILCSAASSAWYWQSFNLQCILINRKKKGSGDSGGMIVAMLLLQKKKKKFLELCGMGALLWWSVLFSVPSEAPRNFSALLCVYSLAIWCELEVCSSMTSGEKMSMLLVVFLICCASFGKSWRTWALQVQWVLLGPLIRTIDWSHIPGDYLCHESNLSYKRPFNICLWMSWQLFHLFCGLQSTLKLQKCVSTCSQKLMPHGS